MDLLEAGKIVGGYEKSCEEEKRARGGRGERFGNLYDTTAT
jgi:hypothetical protein